MKSDPKKWVITDDSSADYISAPSCDDLVIYKRLGTDVLSPRKIAKSFKYKEQVVLS